MKTKYPKLTNVDFSNFIIKNDNQKYYSTKCLKCSADRGYQRPRFANRLCNECSKQQQIIRHIKHNNVNINDFIIKMQGKNKRPQRFYRSSCHGCGKDRGYIEPKNFNKKCLSCIKTKHSMQLQNVNYESKTKEKYKVAKYEIFCPKCGISKGILPITYHNRLCKQCSNNVIRIKKTKNTPTQRRLKSRFSARINDRLMKNTGCGNYIFKEVGYTFQELKQHIESLWEPWMNWNNWGRYDPNNRTWQIDHIIPDSSFTYTSYKDLDFKKSWALKNLQPLEAYKNLQKGNKI